MQTLQDWVSRNAKLILSLLDLNPATIIIDALDEGGLVRRYELLKALDNIIQRSASLYARWYLRWQRSGFNVSNYKSKPSVILTEWTVNRISLKSQGCFRNRWNNRTTFSTNESKNPENKSSCSEKNAEMATMCSTAAPGIGISCCCISGSRRVRCGTNYRWLVDYVL